MKKIFVFIILLLMASAGTAFGYTDPREEMIERALDDADVSISKTRASGTIRSRPRQYSPPPAGHYVPPQPRSTAQSDNRKNLSVRSSAIRPAYGPRNIEAALQFKTFHFETEGVRPYYYAQSYSSPNDVTKTGLLGGGYVAYTWRARERSAQSWQEIFEFGPWPTYVKVEGQVSAGKIDYDSPATGKLKSFNAWEIEGRVLLGYDVDRGQDAWGFTPYTGFGYRRFTDKSGGWVDYFVYDYAKFPTKYSYYYVPIGVETSKSLNTTWDLSLKVEGDIVFYGVVQYYLNEIEGLYSGYDVRTGESLLLSPRNSRSKLESGYGLRSSCKFVRKLEMYNIFIEPFLEFWQISKSDPVEAHSKATNGTDYVSVYDDPANNYPLYKPLFDPKNYTLQSGVRMGVQF